MATAGHEISVRMQDYKEKQDWLMYIWGVVKRETCCWYKNKQRAEKIK